MTPLLHALTLVWFALGALASQAHVGRATTFDVAAADSGNPNDTLGCRPWRSLRLGERAIATYALPCETKVKIYSPRTGKTAEALVLDRGPRRQKRRPDLVHDLDLSTALAADLGLNGDESVVWWVSKP